MPAWRVMMNRQNLNKRSPSGMTAGCKATRRLHHSGQDVSPGSIPRESPAPLLEHAAANKKLAPIARCNPYTHCQILFRLFRRVLMWVFFGRQFSYA